MIKSRSTTALNAAVCLYALDVLKRVGLAKDVSKRQILRELGVARSYAYELVTKVEAAVARGLDEARDDAATKAAELLTLQVRTAVLEYRIEHPGCWVCGGRTVYSLELVAFVVDLASRSLGPQMTQVNFAAACQIPLPTLKDWLAANAHQHAHLFAASDAPAPAMAQQPPPAPERSAPESTSKRSASEGSVPGSEPEGSVPGSEPEGSVPGSEPEGSVPGSEPEGSVPGSEPEGSVPESAPALADADCLGLSADMLRIVAEYEHWHGSLPALVEHLRSIGLRYGRQSVTQILHLAAARKLLRRPPPKPSARGSTFRPPPGVQWTSDGKQVDVVVDEQTFRVNWQPTIDVGTTATVGSVVRPEEDTEGVRTSFTEGVKTTGKAAIAHLLDNKACNKSPALAQNLAPDTFIMHSTVGRAENKAVIEGSFGLFAQALGPVIATVDTSSPETIALCVAGAVTRAYAQGRNHHPRSRDGRTPYQLYRDADPSAEEIAAATERLRAIKQRIDSREAREQARLDPAVMATIEHACQRFEFFDDGDVAISLRTLPLATIQSAIAIYAAKQQARSLPPDAGIRYFAGIARNCQHARELLLFEEELVAQLERTGKLVSDHLERKAASFASLDWAPRLLAIVRELLTITAPVAQVFWRQHFQAEAALAPKALRLALRRCLCERVRRHYASSKQHRQQLIDLVVRALAPDPSPAARSSVVDQQPAT